MLSLIHIFIENIRDIGLVDDRMLVLREDPDHEGFQDITEIVREMKLQVDYGYYSAVSYTHLDVYKRQGCHHKGMYQG